MDILGIPKRGVIWGMLAQQIKDFFESVFNVVATIVIVGAVLAGAYFLYLDDGPEGLLRHTVSKTSKRAPAYVDPSTDDPAAKKAPPAQANGEPSGGQGEPDSAPETKPNIATAIDRILADMKVASAAFNVPTPMLRGQERTVKLLVSLKAGVEELKKRLAMPGPAEGATIKVTDFLEAELTGTMFEIRPGGPQPQALSGSTDSEWRWQVNPKEGGTLPLHLTIHALVVIDGLERRRLMKIFDEEVEVEVGAWDTVKDFFKTVPGIVSALVGIGAGIGGFVGGLRFGWFAKLWRRIRDLKVNPPSSPSGN